MIKLLIIDMKEGKNEVFQGSLELLILRVLQTGDRHGYGIAKRIEQVSGDAFVINMGSLYTALNRLLAKGYVTNEWGEAETGRRAKFYSLTDSGRKQVDVEIALWNANIAGVQRIIENA